MKKRLLSVMLLSLSTLTLAGCGNNSTSTSSSTSAPVESSSADVVKEADTYTYSTWTTSLASNWNPHTWEMSSDNTFLGYLTSPFVDLAVKDSEEQVYQWVYEMATSVEDVTAAHKADLEKYGSDEKDATEGYVYEIKLNERASWQDGTKINADSYINSMKQLLDPAMENYRANSYYTGSSAIAGAYGYYNSGKSGVGAGYVYGTSYEADKASMKFDWSKGYYCNQYPSYTPAGLIAAFGWKTEAENKAFLEAWEGKSVAECLADTGAMKEFLEEFWVEKPMDQWTTDDYDSLLKLFDCSYTFDTHTFDEVGIYKTGEYSFIYVNKTAIDINNFLTHLTSNWLVYEPLYNSLKKDSGGITVTTYGTSAATTMSYGPYTLSTFEDDKKATFVQNPNWYGYTKQADGTLKSTTESAGVPFKVDGEYVEQYKTTKVDIEVMEQGTAKQKFLKGELSDYTPTSDELSSYTLSTQLYQEDETYTMRLFFDTNVDDLKAMDAGEKPSNNTNSVVMSNEKFREAFSLAVDRKEWVTATEAYKPAYYLLNSLYYYDIYEDPTSSYRASDEAKQAIVNLYGVEYGTGKTYKTLDEAYAAITGYDLSKAKQLMKEACDELVAAGLYTAGQEIKIDIAYAKGALTSDNNKQVQLFNNYINAAAEGSGFGTITFTPVGNLSNRYNSVATGDYCIGYGAWGGAAFYPFTMFQVYMDPSYTSIHEARCWDPTTETATYTWKDDEGKTVTDEMTYQKWSGCLDGTGKYAKESNAVKLQILAQMEEDFLSKYYCIPLATTTASYLLSYQIEYYTEEYQIMYGFGGFRLLNYKYSDKEWADYVSGQGGTLKYN